VDSSCTFKPESAAEVLSQSFNLTQTQPKSKQVDEFLDELDYSDDSGFGRELASDSERDDLDFTTDEGSSMFSRAMTPADFIEDPIGSLKRRPTAKP